MLNFKLEYHTKAEIMLEKNSLHESNVLYTLDKELKNLNSLLAMELNLPDGHELISLNLDNIPQENDVEKDFSDPALAIKFNNELLENIEDESKTEDDHKFTIINLNESLELNEKKEEIKQDKANVFLENFLALDLDKAKIIDLKEIAKKLDIPQYYKYKKAVLVEILKKKQNELRKTQEAIQKKKIEKINTENKIKKEQKIEEAKAIHTNEKEAKNTKEETSLEQSEVIETLSVKELLNEPFENTLIISEIDKKIIFPYTYEDIEKIFMENIDTFSSPQDVVDKYYTDNIHKYKNTCFNRFKETFNLSRKKERLSFRDSFSISMNSFFNTLIHPAIIASCNNLKDLEAYISCVEFDELEKFNVFDIMYKIPPTINNNHFDFFKL